MQSFTICFITLGLYSFRGARSVMCSILESIDVIGISNLNYELFLWKLALANPCKLCNYTSALLTFTLNLKGCAICHPFFWDSMSDTLLLYSLFNDDALRHSETSFVMLAKVERAMPLGQFCLKSYLSHQYQSMIECAAIVICLIQKKLKSQTKNQFGKQIA